MCGGGGCMLVCVYNDIVDCCALAAVVKYSIYPQNWFPHSLYMRSCIYVVSDSIELFEKYIIKIN